MTAYLDTSAMVPIHVAEATSGAMAELIGAIESVPYISDFGAGEFASAIARLARMDLATSAQAKKLFAAFDLWIEDSVELLAIEPRDIAFAGQIVRRIELGLRLPDAVHLAVCANRNLTLVSLDKTLLAAAVNCGVETLTL